MSFNWQYFLDLAEYMNSHVDEFPDAEACYRAVASRAYYAVFCLTRNYVKAADEKIFHGNDHQALQDHLKRNPRQKIRCKIGNQLKKLHQIRKKADYDDDLHEHPANTAGQGLSEAKRIINGLNQLSQ